jgi:dTDP-4-dehydrorhamnose reductase
MNVIVFGANGMLGTYVCTYLDRQGYNVFRKTREDIDLSNFNEYSKLEAMSPDVFINCAGTIKPVASNQDPSKTFMINSVFPNYLARVAIKKQIPCFHITTDCIYSGEDGFYNEAAFPDMLDDYGFSKSLGDYSQEFCMVIRTSIIGEELHNKRSLLEWA